MATRTFTLDAASAGVPLNTGTLVDFYMTSTNVIATSEASDV